MVIQEELQKLNKILKKCNLPIIKKIVKYQDEFIQKKSLTKIKKFIIKLSEDRKIIKELIHKYERNILEIDKKIVIKNKHIDELLDNKLSIENILIQLNTANENIKQTLKKIIIKIK